MLLPPDGGDLEFPFRPSPLVRRLDEGRPSPTYPNSVWKIPPGFPPKGGERGGALLVPAAGVAG